LNSEGRSLEKSEVISLESGEKQQNKVKKEMKVSLLSNSESSSISFSRAIGKNLFFKVK